MAAPAARRRMLRRRAMARLRIRVAASGVSVLPSYRRPFSDFSGSWRFLYMPVALDNIALRISHDLTAAEIALRKIPNDDPNGAFWGIAFPQNLRAGMRRFLKSWTMPARASASRFIASTEVGRLARACFTRDALRKKCRTALCAGRFPLSFSLGGNAVDPSECIRQGTGLLLNLSKAGWHVAEITLRKHI